MSFASFLVARAAKLPPRRNRAQRSRDLMIAMRDGVRLAAELHRPRKEGTYPTLLVRVPYGLRAFSAVATAYAERGYNVVLEACRGTDRSEGEFDPLIHEREDGLDTLAWIKAQPWFDGRLGTTGASYLGYAQWAISDSLPKQSAMAIKISSAEFKSVVFPGGSFHLGLWLGWMQIVLLLRKPPLGIGRKLARGFIEKRTLAASMKLPLIDADRRATGREVPFWHRWLAGAIGNDEFWKPLDHTHRIGPRTPPTTFVSGWYDFMIDQLLRDYATLAMAGGAAQLTVGPWWHISPELQLYGFRDTLAWMDAKLRDDPSSLPPKPVRLFVTGADEWRDFDAWPPSPIDIEILHLHVDKSLALRPANASPPTPFHYDPHDPTPNVGGAAFAFTGAGPVDQAPLESRKDVLLFTSGPMVDPLTIIGNVRAVIYVKASLPHADLFVRLNDVDESGRSINICDGIVRKSAPDPTGLWRLNFKLHATAHRFAAGHRLRLVIAAGAHPRFARNTGTDEPFGTATTLRTVDFDIFHDIEHPSAIHLPVFKD
jgi:putative CocE/NonD family hydrolase